MITAQREQRFAQLGATHFDLLVIGGGIVGAGIARDAVMRGLKVALVEQGDFASGTSSKTSKLIHGGLRYLEHGHLRLVFESLRERHVLKTIAPSLVKPLSLMIPVYDGDTRSSWNIRLGLSLYDLLSWGRTLRPHRMVSARRAAMLEPNLRIDGLRAAGLYADCQMDDARLCLVNVLQAISFGAVCCNYTRLLGFLTSNGQVCGGVAEDVFTGRAIDVHARVVVNAAGPWSDRIRRLSQANAPARLAPTKGVHLILPRLTQEALFVEARADHRMFFVLPWGDDSLVGTTETSVGSTLETLRATSEEVGYLLEETNRVLPGSHVDESDVIATFAGARPLLAFVGASTRASREHRIDIDASGLISVLGGKYTTYRVMAQQTVDCVMRRRRWGGDRCLTDQVSLLESMHPVTLEYWRDVTQRIDRDALTRLLFRYGAATAPILQLMDHDPSLSRPVCPHHEMTEAELIHAVERELACTITDVLARRTRIAWSACHGLDLLATMVHLMQRYGGLSPHETTEQVEAYQQFLADGLAFRPSPARSQGWVGAAHPA